MIVKKPSIGFAKKKGERHLEIVDLREFSEDEVLQFRAHFSIIRARFENEMLAFLIMDNFTRLEKDIVGLMKALTARPRDYEEISEDALHCINLHICNLLSSVRTYVDHQETKIKRRYGDPSNELEKFKKATSHEYDHDFSYRFMYHLRNYIQHCGLPVSQAGVQHKLINRDTGEIEISMNPHAIKSSLLAEHRWKQVIRDDLSNMPEEIALIPIAEKYIQSVKRIHASTVDFSIDEVRASAKYFMDLGQLNPENPTHVSLFVFDNSQSERKSFTQTKIPLSKIGLIKMSADAYGVSLFPET